MPRDINGNYTLTAGNPVVAGTNIEAPWANTTLSDVATAMTDSLSRTGNGGMLVSFKNADGTMLAPGMSWTNEPTSGWYRKTTNQFWYSVANTDIFSITNLGVSLAAGKTAPWVFNSLLTAKGSLVTATAASTPAELAVGTDGQVLTADSTQPKGVRWSTSSVPTAISPPKGRLTLTPVTPVTTADVTSATTLYYTPYNGNTVPIYNGTTFSDTVFAELSQLTTDATKSPAAVAANKVYDIFVWSDGGTMRATRGPAWTNDTTRGYTLTMTNGILLNTSAITNGPTALRGTWAGSVYSDASNQLNDTAALRHVSNYYNRARRNGFKTTATPSWPYQTNAFRQANAETLFRCDVLLCAAEILVDAEYAISADVNTISAASIGIGIDSITIDSATRSTGFQISAGTIQWSKANYSNYPGVGRHTIVPLEKATGTTMTWRSNFNGQNASTGIALTVDA